MTIFSCPLVRVPVKIGRNDEVVGWGKASAVG